MNDDEVARIRTVLARAIRAICPERLSSEVEDLTQAAALKILEKSARDSAADPALNATYLWRTAHSVVIDSLRARGRRPSRPLETESGAIDVPATAPDPESSLRGSRLRRAIRDCLERIVAPRRRAVSLRLLGHSVSEVARLCAWPSKRAENLLYRGLSDLRRCLRSKGYGDER